MEESYKSNAIAPGLWHYEYDDVLSISTGEVLLIPSRSLEFIRHGKFSAKAADGTYWSSSLVLTPFAIHEFDGMVTVQFHAIEDTYDKFAEIALIKRENGICAYKLRSGFCRGATQFSDYYDNPSAFTMHNDRYDVSNFIVFGPGWRGKKI